MTVGLIWVLYQERVRQSFIGVLKAFIEPKLLVYMASTSIYSALILFALFLVGYWEITFLKDTIFWFVFSGMFFVFRFVGHNESEATLPTIIKDNLKVIIVIQFLVNTYTFPFVVEIILTPILALVLLIDSVARTDERNLIVTKLTTPVIVSLVLMIIIFAI